MSLLPDASVLAGIHFKNRLTHRPFVGVYAQTRAISDEECLEASKHLGDEFAVFGPPHVRWWSPEQSDLRRLRQAVSDLRLIVGRLEDLQRGAPASFPKGVVLAPDPDGGSYAAYSEIFDDFIRARPEWREDLKKEHLETYQECARMGGLFQIEREGRLVGVIVARPGEVRGIPGWKMTEEILDESIRGSGVAPLMQQAFLARLDGRVCKLVFGTISARNLPSLRTALRVGRRDIGGWVFIPTRG
ncbi:MAG: hypothetical protein EXQ55_01220 [Acidobacteria bacterium]|nr:hypothetical protein [Acidobacteriota bacterium]